MLKNLFQINLLSKYRWCVKQKFQNIYMSVANTQSNLRGITIILLLKYYYTDIDKK